MASALALGHGGLRLRSRRLRSDRSHRLSLWFGLVVTGIASMVGFVGASLSARPESVVDAAAVDQRRFVSELQPLHAEVQRNIEREGMLVATYQSGEIDRIELQRRLASILASYSRASTQIDALKPSPGLESVPPSYIDALSVLSQSATELSKAYDDGNETRVSAALALSLEATARMHVLADLTWPPRRD